MKEEKVRNIYRLKGSTQVSEAAIVSEKEEGTRLWHQRLGHISEKGLQILMKRKSLLDLKSLKFDFCKHCMENSVNRDLKLEIIIVKIF